MIFKNGIFIDSSAWIALTDASDIHYKKAANAYRYYLKEKNSLITSNLIVAETYNLILRNLGYKSAIHFLNVIKTSPRIIKIYSHNEIEIEAAKILVKYTDQDFSYVDVVSFAIMGRYKINLSFSFDKHFLIAGFENVP